MNHDYKKFLQQFDTPLVDYKKTSLNEIRSRFPFVRKYSWWWTAGVGYKRAGELANEKKIRP